MKGLRVGCCVLLLFLIGVSSDTSLRLYKRSPEPFIGEIIKLPFRIFDRALKAAYEWIIRKPIRLVLDHLERTCKSVIEHHVLGNYKKPEKKSMSLVLYTKDDEESIPITNCKKLTESPLFKKDRPLEVLILGWMNVINGKMPKESNDLINAYTQRDKENIVFYDFPPVSSMFEFAAYNTKAAGEYLGECLSKMSIDGDKVHLIGVGLGAQIADSAAKKYNSLKEETVRRITALDPSQPCNTRAWAKKGLKKGSAEFVVAIHTCKYFGTEKTVGDVDFFVNRINKPMPGCKNLVCSHFRAMEFYTESVLSEENFVGVKCDSERSFNRGSCENNKTALMGLKTPNDIEGTFYLNVKSRSPYGNKAKTSTSPKITTTTKPTSTTSIDTTPKPEKPEKPEKPKKPEKPEKPKKPEKPEKPEKPKKPEKPEKPKKPEEPTKSTTTEPSTTEQTTDFQNSENTATPTDTSDITETTSMTTPQTEFYMFRTK